ncbi:MAG: hypothetical protein ACYDA3_00805 [Gaiellaceae bacterium]
MSSGLYALIGVLLGGGLTAATQVFVGLFTTKRNDQREWKIAVRLVSEDLMRTMLELRGMVENGTTPFVPIDDRFMSTQLWEQYRSVIARELPDSDQGEDFWTALAAINSTTSHQLRPLLETLPPGTPLDPPLLDALRDGFDAAWGAYEALNGVSPSIRQLNAPTETADM